MAGKRDDEELARSKRALDAALVRAHVDGLADFSPGRRVKAARGLAALGPAAGAAVVALEAAVRDEDERVRRAAAAALRSVCPHEPAQSRPVGAGRVPGRNSF